MQRVAGYARIECEVTIRLNESEARALNELGGYGADAFLKVYYEKLGRSYLEPYEAGIRSLFETIGQQVPEVLRRMDAARRAWEEKK